MASGHSVFNFFPTSPKDSKLQHTSFFIKKKASEKLREVGEPEGFLKAPKRVVCDQGLNVT